MEYRCARRNRRRKSGDQRILSNTLGNIHKTNKETKACVRAGKTQEGEEEEEIVPLPHTRTH